MSFLEGGAIAGSEESSALRKKAMKRLVVALAVLLPAAGLAQVLPDTGFVFYTIPGVVNASGLNNTRFVSDVAITNPGTQDAFLIVSFVPAGNLTQQVLTLPAGATAVWRNVLQELWSSTGAGALSIGSDQKLILRARTYNTAAGGTYGVALPVYDSDGFILPGQRAHSLWVSQSADPNAGYRTNIAVLFPDADGGDATVTVFDADGTPLGHQDYSLASAGFQQFGVGSFAGAAPVARAEIQVSRGEAAGYSVVVDNVTGDSSLFTFEALPGGIQDVLVNGVARANGRNSTFFRTDGRFFNPGATDATVTVAFHANQTSNPSPVTRDFVIPAGKIRDVVDVLDSLLGLPVGSAGALRFTSDSAVAILCRTSNVDPFGVRPGTFGAQQKPVPLLSFLSSADEGALITGLRQNAAFRTNVGFAAGEEGASWTLTLRTVAGTALATAAGALGPFGWTQPNVQDLFPALSIPDGAALQVKVTSGSVDVFDSSIDNASGDPVVTPITLLPTEIPSSATIGPAGGAVRSDDGKLTLKIPAGALASPTAISLAPVTGLAEPAGSGAPYQILPTGLAFSRPALLVQSYTAEDLIGVAGDSLSLAVWNGSTWYGLTGGAIDPSRRTLTVTLDGLAQPQAAARGALAGSGPGYVVGSYWSVALDPGRRIYAVEGSKVHVKFSVIMIYPSTAKTKKGAPSPLERTHTPFATWSVDGKEIGFDQVLDYPIPDCAPAKEVRITADTGLEVLSGGVITFPRNWVIEIRQTLSIDECEGTPPGSPGVPLFKSGTILERSFTLADDLKAQMASKMKRAEVVREEPSLCPYLGSDCHFTAISMGVIADPGAITSVEYEQAMLGEILLKVQFTQQPVPSFVWSGSTCNPPSPPEKFPGFPGTTRTERWDLKPDGFKPSPAVSSFAAIPGVDSAVYIAISILPDSSLSCPH
jgi:hypothetical protein